MAKNNEAQLEEQKQDEKKSEEQKQKPRKPASAMDDNRRASELLKQSRETMSVEALQGKIATLQAQLKRAQSV